MLSIKFTEYRRRDTLSELLVTIEDDSGDVVDHSQIRWATLALETGSETAVAGRAEVNERESRLTYAWRAGGLDIPPCTYAVAATLEFEGSGQMTAPTTGTVEITIY